MGKKKSELVLLKIDGEIDDLETEYEVLSNSRTAVSPSMRHGARLIPEKQVPRERPFHVAAVQPVNIRGNQEKKGDRRKVLNYEI
jgi:hypothetical protein